MGPSRCTGAHSMDSAFCTLHFNDNKLLKFPSSLKTFLRKMMIWELGLSCFFPKRLQFEEPKSKTSRNPEQNKTWLLAESAGGPELTAVEPQSVHSSFRYYRYPHFLSPLEKDLNLIMGCYSQVQFVLSSRGGDDEQEPIRSSDNLDGESRQRIGRFGWC